MISAAIASLQQASGNNNAHLGLGMSVHALRQQEYQQESKKVVLTKPSIERMEKKRKNFLSNNIGPTIDHMATTSFNASSLQGVFLVWRSVDLVNMLQPSQATRFMYLPTMESHIPFLLYRAVPIVIPILLLLHQLLST